MMQWRRHLYGIDPAAVERAIAERRRSHEEEFAMLHDELLSTQQRVVEQERLLAHLQSGVEGQEALCDHLRAAQRAVAESAEEVCRALEQGFAGTAAERNRQSAADTLARHQSRIEEESRRLQRWLKQVAHIAEEIGDGVEPSLSRGGAAAVIPPVPPVAQAEGEDSRNTSWPQLHQPMGAGRGQHVGMEGWRPGTVTLDDHEPTGSDPDAVRAPVRLTQGGSPLMPSDAVLERLLSGKVSGRDLYASGGQLLLKRGAPITPEAVARAQREGVLAELVLHMAWPEGSPR